MKNILKIVCTLLSLAFVMCLLLSCGDVPAPVDDTPQDYVSSLKLDMTSDTIKKEAKVKAFIDGDTTHFYISDDRIEGGVLKARYLAVNTPESTGKIEEYGKKASEFTKARLSSATSIIIESDNDKWNVDSTGGRYLVWVWYKTGESDDYRCLNLEILQNGLAIASSTASNRYGTTCVAALNQAKSQKLNVFSGEKDPDFYYGDAVELTLRELRCNIEDYSGIKVAFEGVVTRGSDGSVYVEELDSESGLYFGMVVYCGYNLSGAGLSILNVGNRVRIVGTVQFWETGGTYQVSGISYRAMKPDDPSNIQKLGEGFSPAYVPVSAQTFTSGKVSIESDEEEKTFDYAYLAMNTTVLIENLKVESIDTTSDTGSDDYGAMTLYCTGEDGAQIQVRTAPMRDENGELITDAAYLGKTIDVRGLVDYFGGKYQVKTIKETDINIKD